MAWSDRIFRYHFCLLRDTLRAIPADPDPNSPKNWHLVFAASDEYEDQLLAVRANLIACVYTVRNAYDHLAQLVNAMLMPKPMSVGQCDLPRLVPRLPASPVKDELVRLIDSPEFKYVAAYSNTSKHRGLVKQSFHISFEEGTVGVRAESFSYGTGYSARMVSDLLEDLLAVKNRIIECGKALNAQVLSAKT